MPSKNMIVIGASSGIGYSLAQQLMNEANTVFSFSRHQPKDLSINHINWDATSPSDEAFKSLPDSIHGLVYCPGSILLKPFHRISLDEFKLDFQVNVLGAVSALQILLPRLKRAEGSSVVMFSTVAVQTGMGFHASVAASKGAVEGLARSLAAEWAAHKIRVNVIAPSLTDTPLAKNLLSSEDKKEASNKRHPLGRYGQPSDVASMAAFLLSEKSAWITGQVIGVDGGMGTLKNF